MYSLVDLFFIIIKFGDARFDPSSNMFTDRKIFGLPHSFQVPGRTVAMDTFFRHTCFRTALLHIFYCLDMTRRGW